MTEELAKLQENGIGLGPDATERALTPMDLIQLAVSKDADITKIEKLLELQMKWEANEAKKAFVVAMNAFKAEPPEIFRDRRVAYKDVAYRYATLANVCDQVTGALSKHGISHRWRTEQSEGMIRVTCVLTHEMGHSEETTLAGAPDTSGSKNAVQAIGSTVKYLQRYTLLAATGLEAGEEDDDGQGGQPMEKLQEFLDAIGTAPNLNILQRDYMAAFKEATRLGNTKAMKLLVDAKDARKQILSKGETGQA
jgi:hypothetical protein